MIRGRREMLEKRIEKASVKAAEQRGWLSYKFSSPACRGVPDRIFIKNGRAVFIEYKREGGAYKVTALQEYTHNKMREHGAEVHVCRSVEDTIKALEE